MAQCVPPVLCPLLPQDDKEKRRLEALERKKENQRLLDEEASTLKGRATKEAAAAAAAAAAGGKVTRAQIEETLRAEEQQHPGQPRPKGTPRQWLKRETLMRGVWLEADFCFCFLS